MTEKPIIKVFIQSNLKGPAKREGRFVFVLQFVSSNGMTAELNGGGMLFNVGENELFLGALIEALSHIQKSSNIIFYVENEYFKNTYLNGWLKEWKKLGWRRSNGAALANAMLWRRVDELLLRHVVSFDQTGENEFCRWLNSELLLASTCFVQKYFGDTVRQRLKSVEDLIKKEGGIV